MLERCIAPDAGLFATRYWGREPLLSRAADLPRDFSDLLSPTTVDELIAERGVRAPFIRMARRGDLLARDCYLGSAGFGAEMTDQVDSAKVLAEFAAGATIVLQGLHRLWPPLIDFVRYLVDDLGHPTQANAYITPPGGQGFDPHYDVHDVFVLQVAGEKHWTVHPPVHTDPMPNQPWTDHRAAITARAAEPAVIDTVLRAGDALYLPRGWLHSARANDVTSIHLTVGVAPLTRVDLARAVVTALTEVDDFRASLPLGVDTTDRDAVAGEVDKVIADVVDVLRDRAGEIASRSATAVVREYLGRTRPAPVRPLASLAASDTAKDPIRWRHGLVADLGEDRDGRTVLSLPGKTMTFPASCAAALTALRDGQVTDADALPGLDEADSVVLIRRLLREAVLVPVDESGLVRSEPQT